MKVCGREISAIGLPAELGQHGLRKIAPIHFCPHAARPALLAQASLEYPAAFIG